MNFQEVMKDKFEKTGISVNEHIKELPPEFLKCNLLKCIGYTGVVPKELLNKDTAQTEFIPLVIKIFKNISFYYDKKDNLNDFFELITLLNNGISIQSEVELLNIFNLYDKNKKFKIYLSLYHHLFIFLKIILFTECTILYFSGKQNEISEKLTKNNIETAYFLDLIYYLIAVDGKVDKHELNIFNELSSVVYGEKYSFEKKELSVVLNNLKTIGFGKEILKTIYKISIITIMLDNEEDELETKALTEIRDFFAISQEEHNQLLLDVTNYLHENEDLIHQSTLNKIFNSFEKHVIKKVTNLVKSNKDKILKELTETKDMGSMMMKWKKGEKLSDEEKSAFQTQLFDILKTIPALGIFLLPGGTILLPVLSKILPFNILPSSFAKEKKENESDKETEDKNNDKKYCL